MINKTLSAIGSLLLIAGLLLTLSHAWHEGWIESVVPERPIAAAVQITLRGPKQTLAGGEYYFHVDVTTKHGPIVWKLVPPVAGALTVMPDGETALFQTIEPGVYSLQVAVAGDGLQAAADHVEFENLETIEAAPPSTEQPHQQQPPVELPPIPTIGDLVLQAFRDVPSSTKASEAAVVVGCLRSLASRLRAGQLSPDADVGRELADHVELALGERGKDWGLFVAEVQAILQQLRLQGDITTAVTAAAALDAVAEALSVVVETARN